ncbi:MULTISPECIES: amidohydrolase family protein [Burkholderia]|uniref:amidohydrolase family protein n=1 Tax=Burkholderia TaxID=32008 RepID=UPI001588AFC9|nr:MULTISPECIES: amidohydrolase family protein [Burkholderia]MDF3100062.1 amidohydrolase family protein [Burkholderia semiarida]MDF3104555.1 amidohydrolase family protein [Burkholderia semiarida]MDN7485603.1 amidohydrolase family protein [Burkholderia orbicola]
MNKILLTGARVITMAENRPDVEDVDLLIEGDKILAIGNNLSASGAVVVDLSGRIIIPGLINAHLHSWQTPLRCVGAAWTLLDYLANMHGGVASHYTPDDMRIAALAGALNQINCGVTTLGDWCHNTQTPQHAEQAVAGLVDSGIRAVFLHGTPHTAADAPHPLNEVDRLMMGPISHNPLLTLGMAIKGPQYSTTKVAIGDLRAAHERGLVVSMHQSGGRPGAAWEAVRDAGVIGSRTNIVHGADLDDDWLKTLVGAGANFTITPENELAQGHGVPITGRLMRLGISPSLGTDVESAVSGEILIAARVALAHQRGLDHQVQRQLTRMAAVTSPITSKQALSWVTVEGARSMGMFDRVGRLLPGMQADLVVIDTSALNLWPAHEPIVAALHASIANIEAVMIAGAWRKRGHQLLREDLADVKNRILNSGQRLVYQLNRPGFLPRMRRHVVRSVVRRRLVQQARE